MSGNMFRCPCGSSREYSECCGKPPKVVSMAQVRWRRASGILRGRIGDFAEEVIFIKEAARAQDCFFGPLRDELEYLDPELMAERCFEWFLFDCPLSSGQTVIELFRDLFMSRLPLPQALLLMLWGGERSRFYKVQAIFPGRGLAVRDVLNGKTFEVHEPAVRSDVESGTILYARLLRVGTEHEFSTSAIGIPAEAGSNLIGWLRADYRRCAGQRSQRGKVGWDDYLRFRSPTINRKLVRLGLGYQDMPPAKAGPAVSTGMPLEGLQVFNGFPAGNGKSPAEFEALLDHLRGTNPAGETLADQTPDLVEAEVYASVAGDVACGLVEYGFTPEEVNQALRLWWDFCVLEEPVVRKPGVWAAAVIYTMLRLHERNRVTQTDLARRFGVAVSSISNNYGRFARVLGLG